MLPKPLKGITVLDLSIFLAGPYAALRLQDLGARVIKLERPDGGDLCRGLYKEEGEEDSTLFHAINRGKESVTVDLKSAEGVQCVMSLIEQADVLIQNFRPGVAERLGLAFDAVQERNPRLVYASISGYGSEGEWAKLPGQDLLAQARSGVMWLNGNAENGPTPVGLALADIYTSGLAVQGVLAGLVGRSVSGVGCLVQTSLLEALLDLQFEMLAHYFQTGRQSPTRSEVANANVNAPPPYGVYQTQDGYLALAMTSLPELADLLGIASPTKKAVSGAGRDHYKALIAGAARSRSTADWLAILEPKGVWCAEVLDWDGLIASSQFQSLGMHLSIPKPDGSFFETVSSPLTINKQRPASEGMGPRLGEHTDSIMAEFGLT